MIDGELTYEVTPDDLRRQVRFLQRRRRRAQLAGRFPRVALSFLAFLVAVATALTLWIAWREGSFAWFLATIDDPVLRLLGSALGIVVVLYVLIELVQPSLALLAARRIPDAFGPRQLGLTDDGVRVVTVHTETTIAWSSIVAIEESSEAYYLVLPREQAIVVPKRAFRHPHDSHRFREAVSAQLAAGRERRSP
jgi:hypothetical protein